VKYDFDPRHREWRRQAEILVLEQALLTVPSCPSWCDGVESTYTAVESDGVTFVRNHESRIGEGVYLMQGERNRANVVSVSPVEIDVDEAQGLDPAAALRLASALLDAAGKLCEIVSVDP
jgi:hypothetical protein